MSLKNIEIKNKRKPMGDYVICRKSKDKEIIIQDCKKEKINCVNNFKNDIIK